MISVSKILSIVFGADYKDIPMHILENARQRGLQVHESIENFWKTGDMTGALEYEIYRDAFLDWYKDNNPSFIDSERKISDDELEVRGICDLLVEIDGKTVLIDMKVTHTLNLKYVELQQSFYRLLLNKNGVNVDESRVLHLTKQGYKYIELKYKPILCLDLLNIYRYLKEQ